jgi:hypothetical protein
MGVGSFMSNWSPHSCCNEPMVRMTCRSPLSIALLSACFSLACTASTAVGLRADGGPGPQKCSDKALEVMKILRLRPGDSSTIVVDANQTSQSPIIVSDGPIESFLEDSLGFLDPLTRMYGQVWTGGTNVIIRYYEARPPDGEPLPICAVARLGHGQLRKVPGPNPGTAQLEFPIAGIYIVDGFR